MQMSSGTQKLQQAAEAGKLKFEGSKNQYLFHSEQGGALDEAANFLAWWDFKKAFGKVEVLRKSSYAMLRTC